MKNVMWRFKRRFLILYSTKSQLQALRGCGNGCRRGWNRDVREGRCLNRSIFLISNSNLLQIRRTPCFIGHLGVTVRSKRSTVTMERSIMDRFRNVAAVGSEMERQDELFEIHYKTHEIASLRSRSDGRDV